MKPHEQPEQPEQGRSGEPPGRNDRGSPILLAAGALVIVAAILSSAFGCYSVTTASCGEANAPRTLVLLLIGSALIAVALVRGSRRG